jgi:mannose-6-phosphate isomerase-like protein (cupin superfamily)
MQHFELPSLLARLTPAAQPAWLEFLRVPSLSMGLYRLAAGQVDRQQPHTEDEVYYVLAGRATFHAGDQELPAAPGTILFVERGLEHRFTDIQEDLTVLVFFAPAEHSQKPKA